MLRFADRCSTYCVLHTKADAALMMQLGCDGGRRYFVPHHANVIDTLFFSSVRRFWDLPCTFSKAEYMLATN